MAIKPLQLKTQINVPQVSKSLNRELADGPFRSLQDVQVHLDEIKTHIDDLDGMLKQYQLQFSKVQPLTQVKAADLEFVVSPGAKPKGPRKGGGKTFNLDKIDKVVIPKMDILRKNFGIADELGDQVDQLDKLYNSIAVNFRGVRGSSEMLKNVKDLQKNAEMKLDKALKFLGDIGERHTPKDFKDLIEETIGDISPELEFKSHKTYMYGYETKEQNLGFSVYIELLGLTDEEGNVFPKFYFVFTCILKGNPKEDLVEPVYYLTVMHDFATPGKYSLGKKISSPAEAATTLGMMLEMENIYTAIGTQPHNLDPAKVKKGMFKASDKVAKIGVEPNSVIFDLVKAVKASEANEVAKSLYVDMKGLLTHIKGAKIKVKVTKAESGSGYSVKFTLTNLAKSDQISVNDLDFLKTTFGLDDNKMRKLIKVINEDVE